MGGKGSGLPPKRSDERIRRNEPASGEIRKFDTSTIVAQGVDTKPEIPEPGAKWPEEVVALYRSLRISPSVMFMYASDWQIAWHTCEQLARHMNPQFVGMSESWNSEASQMESLPVMERVAMNGATLNAFIGALKTFGVTEEGRRRMSIEAPPLDVGPGNEGPREDKDDGVVHSIDEARRAGLAG